MLQRIYGISFPAKDELDAYITRLEEIKRRDHRKLGKDLDLFSVSDEVGGGLVLWHPRGALIRKTIEDFWRDEHQKNGYDFVFSPHVGRANLWETSGHLGFYRENMYSSMEVEGQEYLREADELPVPHHDLQEQAPFIPRTAAAVRRAWHGVPVRAFRRAARPASRSRLHPGRRAYLRGARGDGNRGHPGHRVRRCKMLRTFGFDDFKAYIATRPEKSVGDDTMWEQATQALKVAADKVGSRIRDGRRRRRFLRSEDRHQDQGRPG